jgi:hypothetical protein
MKVDFEKSILDSGQIMQKTYSFLVENMGKTVAIITGIIAVLVSFTEIGFCDINSRDFTLNAIFMLICAYIMYFSLEDTGERAGRASAEYIERENEFKAMQKRVDSTKIEKMRDFLKDYRIQEYKYRRENLILTYGMSVEEYENMKSQGRLALKQKRIVRKVEKLNPIDITPKTLLTRSISDSGSEISNPRGMKLFKIILNLIPSTFCMLFTVSIMLNAKDNLTSSDIIDSIVKLTTLPTIALKGYCQGYSYATEALPAWLQTKTNLIEAFLKSDYAI